MKAIAAAAITLLAGEAAIRLFESRLSLDSAHLKQIPAILGVLGKQSSPRVLFIGNSLTRLGVDTDVFSRRVEQLSGVAVHAACIHPDDTTIADWYYLAKKSVASASVKPDLVVLGYAGSQLKDNQQLHVNRLGGRFTSFSDAGEIFEQDVPGFGDRVMFLLSSSSALVANSERVRLRLLATLIPHYTESAQSFNSALRAGPRKTAAPEDSYTRLRRFLDMFREAKIGVAILAIPLPDAYDADPEMVSLIHRKGAQYIDLRHVQGVGKTDFPDGYHLSHDGAVLFSRALAERFVGDEALSRVLAGQP